MRDDAFVEIPEGARVVVIPRVESAAQAAPAGGPWPASLENFPDQAADLLRQSLGSRLPGKKAELVDLVRRELERALVRLLFDTMMTRTETAAFLSVSPKTLDDLRQGKVRFEGNLQLPTFPKASDYGGGLRWSRVEVSDWRRAAHSAGQASKRLRIKSDAE